MRIFLSAGEASGDALAATLVQELRKTGREFTFEGIGGSQLTREIGPLVANSSSWGAISIVQSLAIGARAIRGGLKGRRAVRRGVPGLFVAIDFGFFNVRMCRMAKKAGWTVLYLMPPGSYHRGRQGKDLKSVADAVVTPFPWSKEVLTQAGVNAFFFGHPIKQLIRLARRAPQPRQDSLLAALPGSRKHELDRNLPMIAEVVGVPEAGIPRLSGMRIEFAVAPTLDLAAFRERWNKLAPGRDDLFTSGDVYGVLSRARAAIVCSGTATLESALMRCPLVVVYRVTKAMVREAKIVRFRMPTFISLPNIVLDRKLVPELVGVEIAPQVIRDQLDLIWSDGADRASQIEGFEEIDAILGPDDAVTRTAELIVAMIDERTSKA
jgi:lipid-A-disaccharide synthase